MPRDTNLAVEAGAQRVAQIRVAAQATAGNDLNSIVHRAAADGVVDSVTYLSDTAITGANTNTRSVSLVNLTQSSAVIATLQFNSGVNTVVGTEKAITLSGTAANLNITAGDVLQWQSTHVGTGIADPGGLVVITVGRT